MMKNIVRVHISQIMNNETSSVMFSDSQYRNDSKDNRSETRIREECLSRKNITDVVL